MVLHPNQIFASDTGEDYANQNKTSLIPSLWCFFFHHNCIHEHYAVQDFVVTSFLPMDVIITGKLHICSSKLPVESNSWSIRPGREARVNRKWPLFYQINIKHYLNNALTQPTPRPERFSILSFRNLATSGVAHP